MGADSYISPKHDVDGRTAAVWERVEAQTEVDEVLRSRAIIELKRRIQHWNGDYLPRPSRFKNKIPVNRGTHLVVPADPVELVIVRAVAMTKGAAQFGVSPNGAIFTAEGDGWTKDGPRVDVTRLSWLLDEAADILQSIRQGEGGRFYESGGKFFLAKDKATILEVVDESDPAERPDPMDPSYASRPWWQKAVNTVFRRHWDELPQTSPPMTVSLPDEVRQARKAPVRRRAQHDTDKPGRVNRSPNRGVRPEWICPVHFVLMTANSRCHECATD